MKICVLVSIAFTASISVASGDPFYEKMAELDHQFFEKSFNQCDSDYLSEHIDSGLIFYHDQSGIQRAEQFKANTSKYIFNEKSPKPIRKLIPGTLTLNSLYSDGKLYGVIQQGEHAFYLRDENG